jgi:diguanylate cyclase (GGDEF)-like protein/PAS domain S-box-containing protein
MFEPAVDFPDVLQNLWQQSLCAYYENPIPDLFKEKLFAVMSRYSPASYSLVAHSCALRGLGVPGAEILQLITEPFPSTEADSSSGFAALASAPQPFSWPRAGTEAEKNLLLCCLIAFAGTPDAMHWNAELRRLLGPSAFVRLLALVGFIRTVNLWIEAHPEISYESDRHVRENFLALIHDEPRLAEVFRNYYQEIGYDRERLETEKALRASEERYRELFENANDLVYTHDLEGNLTSINRAAERITGFARAEALQMKFTDFIAPECVDLARRMIDRQIAGEGPSHYELVIVAKGGHRVTLGTSTRLIFREGKPVAVQGIARDITERKRTEEALQLANQKLEAWVNELEQRTREMTFLNEMGDMLRACLSTDEAYSVIVRVAQQIFPVHVGALYVITPSRNLVESAALWGDTALAERVFAPDECWALRRGRIHWVEDTRTGLLCKHLHRPSPPGYLCVPMMAQSEALGVLHLAQSDNNPMTESKQRLAVTMAEHIAMALSNLKLHETLRSQSIRDPLTGLFNRRFMEESLELEIRRAARNQRPLGVIMIDLDHFKHFNDTFGHEAGDTLLRELGALLQTNIRGEDIACRYGGEEFTLILPEGSLEVTRQRADFLREAIKHIDMQHRSQPLGRITASMGVAVFPEHGRTGKSLLESADAALYKSKNDGRDRVTTSR